MLFLAVFFLLLQVSSGAEITQLSMPTGELHVSEGSPLIIPCLFRVASPTAETSVDLEWGKRSSDGKHFTSIIHTYNDIMEPVDKLNSKAQLFSSRLPHGDCTLFIDSFMSSDSGTYELHLRVDEQLYQPAPSIKITVGMHRGVQSKHHAYHRTSSSTEPEDRSGTKISSKPDHTVIDPNILYYARIIAYLNRNGYLLYIEIAAGIILGLLLVGFILVWTCGCFYWRLKRRIRDKIILMEEGMATSGSFSEGE